SGQSGHLFGTPHYTGTFNINVTVADGVQTVSKSFPWTVLAYASTTPSLTTTVSPPTNTHPLGIPVSIIANVSGGTSPFTFLWTGVVNTNTVTGQLSFTPASPGTYVEQVKVTDANGYSALSTVSLIAQAGAGSLTITTDSMLSSIQPAKAGQAYS